MSTFSSFPRIGVGVLVFQNSKILLGERINSHGAHTWSPPGGHLEYGETPEDCAIRELKEETGLTALNTTQGPWTNDFFEIEKKHYISLFILVNDFQGDPIVMEPSKCAKWDWFDLNALPKPLFVSFQNLMTAFSNEQLLALQWNQSVLNTSIENHF
ncbi:MAG: RNA pyrophosphohydrolase [Chlamydiae bacterium]|nr:RNA pyrophosphohydrolase [Chlamydiota bacterium]